MRTNISTTIWQKLQGIATVCSVCFTACAPAAAPTVVASSTTPPAGTPAGPPLFPTLAAQTLAKRAVTFPQETAGKVGLLFVAFERDAQEQINSWLAPLLQQYVFSDEVSYYEVPMISGGYGMVATFIDGGMRRGVPQTLHDRTATYYGPRDAFFKALNITELPSPICLSSINRAASCFAPLVGTTASTPKPPTMPSPTRWANRAQPCLQCRHQRSSFACRKQRVAATT